MYLLCALTICNISIYPQNIPPICFSYLLLSPQSKPLSSPTTSLLLSSPLFKCSGQDDPVETPESLSIFCLRILPATLLLLKVKVRVRVRAFLTVKTVNPLLSGPLWTFCTIHSLDWLCSHLLVHSALGNGRCASFSGPCTLWRSCSAHQVISHTPAEWGIYFLIVHPPTLECTPLAGSFVSFVPYSVSRAWMSGTHWWILSIRLFHVCLPSTQYILPFLCSLPGEIFVFSVKTMMLLLCLLYFYQIDTKINEIFILYFYVLLFF